MQEHAAEPDRSAVHEHELARYSDRPLVTQTLMHTEGLTPSIHPGADLVSDGAHAILEHRAIDEIGPDVEDVDQIVGEAGEAPGLIGVHDQRTIVAQQSPVEIDYALDELRRKGTHAAIIEQVDAGRPPLALFEHSVIAEMRVAMDHAVMAERVPPGTEHGAGDLVALFQSAARVAEQPPPVEPSHGEQPLGGQLRNDLGHADQGIILEDQPVEAHVARFEIVVKLLAKTRGDLFPHL